MALETSCCFTFGLLIWPRVPDQAKGLGKMLYASSKEAIKRRLDGIFAEIQCTDASEIAHEAVLDKVLRLTK